MQEFPYPHHPPMTPWGPTHACMRHAFVGKRFGPGDCAAWSSTHSAPLPLQRRRVLVPRHGRCDVQCVVSSSLRRSPAQHSTAQRAACTYARSIARCLQHGRVGGRAGRPSAPRTDGRSLARSAVCRRPSFFHSTVTAPYFVAVQTVQRSMHACPTTV